VAAASAAWAPAHAALTPGDVLLSLDSDCTGACAEGVVAQLEAVGCTRVVLYPTLRLARATCSVAAAAPDFTTIIAIPGVELVSADVAAVLLAAPAPSAGAVKVTPRAAAGAPDDVGTLGAPAAVRQTQIITGGVAGFWGLDRIDQRRLPLDGFFSTPCFPSQGAGVTVYVIDTGCRATHAEFGGRATTQVADLWTGGITSGVDGDGHGTHVAAIVAGATAGVAKRASVRCIKVFADTELGEFSTIFSALEMASAFKAAAPARKVVVNLSLGTTAGVELGPLTVIDIAMRRMADLGVIGVAAAGNTPAVSACDQIPARAPTAITVAASTIFDRLAPFSSTGACVDVIAPGEFILSADSASDAGFKVRSGTSMASPHVAGIVALLLGDRENGGALTPADVNRLLKAGAPTVAGFALGFVSTSGCGGLPAPPPPPPPVSAPHPPPPPPPPPPHVDNPYDYGYGY